MDGAGEPGELMRYDCRRENRDPTAGHFPCAVKILDARTGERIANVFFLDTAPGPLAPALGRFVVDADGRPLVDYKTRRKRLVDDGRGGRKCEIAYDRLEVWDLRRPWLAVSLETGEVVAKSEGVP